MKKVITLFILTFIGLSGIQAQNAVMVGGEAMYPDRDIIDNAVNSNDHTTLVKAVKAAGLIKTLKGDGPFTVLAPTDAAFDKLPEGTLETLTMKENKEKLSDILTYHVIPGKLDYKSIKKSIKKANGEKVVETVSGNTLTLKMNGNVNIIVKDDQGNHANITTYDVPQSNGVIHVIDTVLMPSENKDQM